MVTSLILAVFLQLHTYWTRIFLIATTTIKKIEGICRNFLWSGDDQFKSPLVSWDQCCNPKKHGGLGFLNYSDWNKASIAKFTWWIASMQDHLWIKWVNAIYIKNRNWWEYSPSINSSWAWRQICKVKEMFKSGYINNSWQIGGPYTVQSGYDWLHPPTTRVRWWPVV
ncbi:putative mitochondrial protein AtMg00310 [Silene latifolia]|uniref:putative mitochondrial protein AtMg00310 n=1 Tax=Silene latifolia TaxID=37657 RepID=UPI003D77B26D